MKQSLTPKTEKNEVAEEVEIAEAYKDSLLDGLRALYEENKELRCTRVLYIGHMTSAKQKDIIESIHKQFIESQKSAQEITGALLFINNNLFYHMIEVDSLECLQSLFEEMVSNSSDNFFQSIDPSQNNKNKINPALLNINVKICCVSEDITREFPIWSVREVNLPGGHNNNDDENKKQKNNNDNGSEEDEEDEVSEDQESLQNLLFDAMKGMIEIGRQLCMKQDKDAAMKLFQSSQREIINRFPTPDKIEFFMESKLLFDLKQFTDYFFTPINIKLESEHIWPIEPMISF